MIHIGICDDDERELSRVMELLAQYKQEHQPDCICKNFRSAVELLSELRGGEYDLLLMDVLMPGLSGMQAAREIRGIDQKVKLLFMSSSPEFAVESYAVGAFSYLLKPVKPDELFALLDRALEELTHQDISGLAVKGRTGFTHIPFSRLEYVEVMSKTVCFHLSDGSVVETSGTLAAYEEELLERSEFLKVHRSYIVNLSYVETLDRGVVATRLSHEIPIGRTLCAQVKDAYMRFLFETKHAAASPPLTEPPVLPTRQPDGVYRVLLVDDEESEQSRWAGIIRGHGCEVVCAKDGATAQEHSLREHFDCVVLDVLLSGEDGFALCQSLHEQTGAPVVFLSCLTDTDSQLRGFSCGGVDYITKDTPAELFWRKVETRIRISSGKRTQLSFGPLLLDQGLHRVTLENRELVLTLTEFDLLWFIAEQPDKIYTPEELYRGVWGDSSWDDGRMVQVHMSKLRRKLGKAYPAHCFIETAWGEGYRFVPAETTCPV